MCNNGLAYLFISSREKMSELKNKIVTEIKKIYDPEIPVNIYELGLIYKIEISDEKKVNIEMTLTSPNCPVAESLPKMVKDNVLKIEEVSDVDLKLVWSPPWTKDCLLYTSPSPRDRTRSRMPSSA